MEILGIDSTDPMATELRRAVPGWIFRPTINLEFSLEVTTQRLNADGSISLIGKMQKLSTRPGLFETVPAEMIVETDGVEWQLRSVVINPARGDKSP